MATIDTILDDLQTHRGALDTPQEGAKDFESVNLKPPAHLLVSEGRGKLTSQRALVMAAIEAVQALANESGSNAQLRALVMAALEALQALARGSGNSTRLRDLVIAVVEALRALDEHSDYPDLPSFEADDPVLNDLDAQIVSLQAFRALVRKKEPPATHMQATFTVSDQP
jgi:DNA repair ATPase RecN